MWLHILLNFTYKEASEVSCPSVPIVKRPKAIWFCDFVKQNELVFQFRIFNFRNQYSEFGQNFGFIFTKELQTANVVRIYQMIVHTAKTKSCNTRFDVGFNINRLR